MTLLGRKGAKGQGLQVLVGHNAERWFALTFHICTWPLQPPAPTPTNPRPHPLTHPTPHVPPGSGRGAAPSPRRVTPSPWWWRWTRPAGPPQGTCTWTTGAATPLLRGTTCTAGGSGGRGGAREGVGEGEGHVRVRVWGGGACVLGSCHRDESGGWCLQKVMRQVGRVRVARGAGCVVPPGQPVHAHKGVCVQLRTWSC